MFTHHIFHPTYFSPTRFFTHHIFHPPYFSPTTSFTHHIFHPPYFSPTTSFTQHIFHHILGRGGGVGSFLLVSIYQLISTITQYYMRGGGKCLNPKISSLFYRGGGSIFDTISQFKLFLQFIITPTLWGGGGVSTIFPYRVKYLIFGVLFQICPLSLIILFI